MNEIIKLIEDRLSKSMSMRSVAEDEMLITGVSIPGGWPCNHVMLCFLVLTATPETIVQLEATPMLATSTGMDELKLPQEARIRGLEMLNSINCILPGGHFAASAGKGVVMFSTHSMGPDILARPEATIGLLFGLSLSCLMRYTPAVQAIIKDKDASVKEELARVNSAEFTKELQELRNSFRANSGSDH